MWCVCVYACVFLPSLRWWMSPLHHHCVHLLLQPQMDSASNSNWHYIDVKQGVWQQGSGLFVFVDCFFYDTFINQNKHAINKQRAFTQLLDEKQESSSDWLILVIKVCRLRRWQITLGLDEGSLLLFPGSLINPACPPPLSAFPLQSWCLMCMCE